MFASLGGTSDDTNIVIAKRKVLSSIYSQHRPTVVMMAKCTRLFASPPVPAGGWFMIVVFQPNASSSDDLRKLRDLELQLQKTFRRMKNALNLHFKCSFPCAPFNVANLLPADQYRRCARMWFKAINQITFAVQLDIADIIKLAFESLGENLIGPTRMTNGFPTIVHRRLTIIICWITMQ